MHRWMSLLFVFTLACASQQSGRPETVAQPEISPALANNLFFGSGTTAPATVDVEITNRANVPIVVRRIEIDTPGMATYGLIRTQRDFRETIEPKATKTLTLFATAVSNTAYPTEPLSIRALVEFQAEGKSWREIVLTH